MTAHIQTDARSNMIGSLWMIAAMAGFALEDALLKAASAVFPIWQVLVLFGAGGSVIFAAVALARGQNLLHPDVLSRPMKVRVLFEVFGRLFYVLAIALTPLSSATVILQATPLVVVAGAAMFFGESVGWRRWSAIFVGMIGVVVILQPTGDSFSLLSILAVLGMLGFAGRDLASRAAPATLGTEVLGFYGFLSIIVAGLAYRFWEGVPMVSLDLHTGLHLTGAVLMGVLAYSSLMKAMRTGEVSAVTPFRYTRLLFGIGLGVVMFGESLDPAMWIGSALIVASGLYILWRGRRA
ncbi:MULTISPECIES: DMT family transporter [unclassified Ruegeria]|uniref:DMT family transporter n=1 Tax=unclassified Ruegeria TaxID=2625375 RepID=UPI001492C64E|nr:MULTISPECIES: DMT family transporter [unclassified Ruegeria]NOD89178.1 EamA family transporter [Ruegeria sp. HKCCD4318]NOE13659.1 EamA family transporter [Ruegeria sp. HKCCD4318-2]NOG07590.1 DMT family transporter [Ruegeria sp. HKCCD4315]